MSLNIVNIKSRKPFDIYIGRANVYYNQPESIFHNPFVIGKDGTRVEVIEKFREYALKTPDILSKLYLLDEKVLGCYCDYPAQDCHGRVLFELRQAQLERLVCPVCGQSDAMVDGGCHHTHRRE